MKKILMFGFRDLGEIMKIAAAAERCGAELQPVGRESCTLTLEALSQGKTGGASSAPIGKILVFCGLDRELDTLLVSLRQAGIICLKAVLTPNNRTWTPERLYRELEREHRAMGGR